MYILPFLLALLLGSGSGFSQELLKDINLNSPQGSNPENFTVAGNLLFFTCYGLPEFGTELWVLNGNTAYMVKDIRPGPESSLPEMLTAFDNRIYFSANDGSNGRELWVSDGTAGGTFMVLNIRSGPASSDPGNFTAGMSQLFFAANDGVVGRELWKTDGTTMGTSLVKDIRNGSPSSDPGKPVYLNDYVYFTANDGATGSELWRSDGLPENTRRVRDLYPGSVGSNPRELIVFNNKLAFFADRSPSEGWSLFLTTGDSIGTSIVKHFGISSGAPRAPVVVNNMLFFWVNGNVAPLGQTGWEPWVSNGTFNGTLVLKDIYPGITSSILPESIERAVIGNELLFLANDGVHAPEIWKTDGSEAGTLMVTDVNGPSRLTAVGNTVFFSTYSQGLWKTDGTEAGTSVVKNFALLPPGYITVSSIYEAIAFNGLLYFTADVDGSGPELWRSNGYEEGTVQVTDIHPETASSIPQGFHALGGYMLFSADDGIHGRELWRTDGTTAGTSMVKDINPGLESGNPELLTPWNGAMYFVCRDAGTVGLWKTDGTLENTVKIHDFYRVRDLVVFNNALFFTAALSIGEELMLWRSDGTAAGTSLIKNIPLCFGNQTIGYDNSFYVWDNRIYMCANGELWVSDGTTDGTVELKNINLSGNSNPGNFFGFGDWLYFAGTDADNGRHLWRTNGLLEGTNFFFSASGLFVGTSNPHGFYDAGRWLFFRTWDGYNYRDWATEGGTVFNRDQLLDNVVPSGKAFLLSDGVTYLFVASAKDGSTGTELWKGSLAYHSTAYLVKDINPGSAGSSPSYIFRGDGDDFYFTANDGVHGNEIWSSDGASEGTFMIGDIYPGRMSSEPYEYYLWNNALYFSAVDFDHGNELWKLALSPLPVTWLEFHAQALDDYVRLNWITETEQDNQGFEVQRLSLEGKWKEIGFVPGAGNSVSRQHYQFNDMHPFKGLNYYRLRQEDWDGRSDYSKVVGVRFTFDMPDVYPNPGFGELFLFEPAEEYLVIHVYDATGRRVWDGELAPGARTIPLPRMPVGVYWLHFQTSSAVSVLRIVRQ